MREKTKTKYLISLSLSILLLTLLVPMPETEASASNPDIGRHLVGEWEAQLKVNNVEFSESSAFTKESFYKRNGTKGTVKFSLSDDNLFLDFDLSRDIKKVPLTYQEGKFIYVMKNSEEPDKMEQVIVEVVVNHNGNKIGFTLNVLQESRDPQFGFLVLDYTYKNTTDRVIEENIPQINSERPELSLSVQAAKLWESLKEALAGESFQVQTPTATCGVRG